MTRINVISPKNNTTINLLAEWKELVRIPNKISSGKTKLVDPKTYLPRKFPQKYVIRSDDYGVGGSGHELFFVPKLKWLHKHYMEIIQELSKRGYQKDNQWPSDVNESSHSTLWGDWEPDTEAYTRNIQRMYERFRDGNGVHRTGHKNNPKVIDNFDVLYDTWKQEGRIDSKLSLSQAWQTYTGE